MHTYLSAYLYFFSPLRKHPEILQKLAKTPKNLQKLTFFCPNFLSFFTLSGPIMTYTGFPMFSKPPILYLNLHNFL